MRILAVEDEGALRDMYEFLRVERGHQLQWVLTGQEALDRLIDEDWDVVLLDLMIPPGRAEILGDRCSIEVGLIIVDQLREGLLRYGDRSRTLDRRPGLVILSGVASQPGVAERVAGAVVLDKPVVEHEVVRAVTAAKQDRDWWRARAGESWDDDVDDDSSGWVP